MSHLFICECGEKLYWRTRRHVILYSRNVKNPIIDMLKGISIKVRCKKCGKEHEIFLRTIDF